MSGLDSDIKKIQKRINWVSSQIREEKIELHQLWKELDKDLKKQKELRTNETKTKAL